MKPFLSTLSGNLIACFTGRTLAWRGVAFLLNCILVVSGYCRFHPGGFLRAHPIHGLHIP